MADKISEALWKAFTKKQKLEVELEDKDLLKALARFEKTDERKPEPRLQALEDLIKEIPKQVTALVKLKKKLGDKPFGAVKDELYAILEEAETLQKKTQAALDAEGDADEEDDEPGNVLLEPKRLLAMLTRCKRDPELSMRFAFIDAKDKQGAVFAMHPKMSGKKLFAALQAETGVKTGAFGSAWVQVNGEFAGTCLMLQLDKPLSGLVKKVKGPVKAAGFKIAKAVLWNADGTVFEQEDESEGTPAPGAVEAVAAPAPGAPAEPNKTAPAAPLQPSVTYAAKLAALMPLVQKAAAAGSADAVKHQKLLEFAAGKATAKDFLAAVAGLKQVEQLLNNAAPKVEPGADDAPMARGTQQAPPMGGVLAFKSRLTGLLPRIKATEAAGGPVAAQIVAKREEAIALARQKGATPEQMAQAIALLDEIESLIATSGVQPATGSVPKVAAATGPKVVFQQTRLEWDTTRKQVRAELQKLEAKIVADCQGESDIADIQAGTKNLYTLLEVLDERLIDKLDEALNATEAAQRQRLHLQAREIVDEYIEFIDTDDLVADIDSNGFVDVAVRSTLTRTLNALASKLAAA